eukprot:71978-Chlamydomonas_euryale.AAC.3
MLYTCCPTHALHLLPHTYSTPAAPRMLYTCCPTHARHLLPHTGHPVSDAPKVVAHIERPTPDTPPPGIRTQPPAQFSGKLAAEARHPQLQSHTSRPTLDARRSLPASLPPRGSPSMTQTSSWSHGPTRAV